MGFKTAVCHEWIQLEQGATESVISFHSSSQGWVHRTNEVWSASSLNVILLLSCQTPHRLSHIPCKDSLFLSLAAMLFLLTFHTFIQVFSSSQSSRWPLTTIGSIIERLNSAIKTKRDIWSVNWKTLTWAVTVWVVEVDRAKADIIIVSFITIPIKNISY